MKKLRFVAFLVALTVVFAMFSGFTSTEGANQEPEQEMEPITAQPFVLPDIIEQTEAMQTVTSAESQNKKMTYIPLCSKTKMDPTQCVSTAILSNT